ncbi:MAG TPA: hypothetical protein GXZ90_07390 [Clostridiales bacterium]|nr:hypothetical protein [Clostridiales bacterium]
MKKLEVMSIMFWSFSVKLLIIIWEIISYDYKQESLSNTPKLSFALIIPIICVIICIWLAIDFQNKSKVN